MFGQSYKFALYDLSQEQYDSLVDDFRDFFSQKEWESIELLERNQRMMTDFDYLGVQHRLETAQMSERIILLKKTKQKLLLNFSNNLVKNSST